MQSKIIRGEAMKIAIGSDHRGLDMRRKIVAILAESDIQVIDLGGAEEGCVDYPDIAAAVARLVSKGKADRGILICGTGLGMCITANKFPGVRAAPCHDELMAEISRRHNDLNVLCLSGDLLGERTVRPLVETWLKTEFEGGRHAVRIEKIRQLESQQQAQHAADV